MVNDNNELEPDIPEDDEEFDDNGAEFGVSDHEPHGSSPSGEVEEDFDDMDSANTPRTSSDAEAKLEVANMIVAPKGRYALRQMSRVSLEDERAMVLLELQTNTAKLLTSDGDGNGKGEVQYFGDMLLDTAARYSRARDGQLIVDCLKVIQIEGEKQEQGGSHWG